MPLLDGAPNASVALDQRRPLTVLYGLVAFRQIQLWKIDGYKQLRSFLEKEWKKVA